MSRLNFNPVALAAVMAAIGIALLLGGCHSDTPSRAAVPEATPAVRLIRQQGIGLQFNSMRMTFPASR